MKNINFWHQYIGRNKNGYLNSYGFYLLKQKIKGDFIFNPWFAFFNVFWLLRWRMYAESTILTLIYVETYWYFAENIPNAIDMTLYTTTQIQSLILSATLTILMPLYLIISFISYKLLQNKLDIKFWKYKWEKEIIDKKVKKLNYLLIPFVYTIIYLGCDGGIGTIQQLINRL